MAWTSFSLIGAGILGDIDVGALREHGNPNTLAGTARQHDGAAHHLVGFTGIDAQVHGQIDGLVELGGGRFLDQAQGLVDDIHLVTVNFGLEGLQTLGNFGHVKHPPH